MRTSLIMSLPKKTANFWIKIQVGRSTEMVWWIWILSFPSHLFWVVCEICNQFLMSQLCPLALLWLLSLLSFLKLLPPLSSLPPLTLHRHQEADTERKLPSLLSGGLMKYLNWLGSAENTRSCTKDIQCNTSNRVAQPAVYATKQKKISSALLFGWFVWKLLASRCGRTLQP